VKTFNENRRVEGRAAMGESHKRGGSRALHPATFMAGNFCRREDLLHLSKRMVTEKAPGKKQKRLGRETEFKICKTQGGEGGGSQKMSGDIKKITEGSTPDTTLEEEGNGHKKRSGQASFFLMPTIRPKGKRGAKNLWQNMEKDLLVYRRGEISNR